MTNYNFNIEVKDQTGTAVSGATIIMYDNAGTQVFSAITNASGVIASDQIVTNTNNPKRIEFTKTGYKNKTFYLNVDNDDYNYYMAVDSYITTYCQPEDVQYLLRLTTAFSTSTNPSLSTIVQRINESEDEIDRYCRRAWRETQVVEYKDINRLDMNSEGFVRIYLSYPDIYDFDALEGDKIEIFDGSYTDWVASRTSGRNNDYWLENKLGILYVNTLTIRERGAKLTYRYGNAQIPNPIKKAAILLTASSILKTSFGSVIVPEEIGSLRREEAYKMYETEAYQIMEKYKNHFSSLR